MSRKRRNTSSPEPDIEQPSPKRHDAHDESESEDEESRETPYFDELRGQAGAFPGLGNNVNELFYGPASDGIDYLRMVRSEARGVPSILTAPVTGVQRGTDQADGSEDDEGGYYYDGTYTATRDRGSSFDTSQSIPPAQRYYYDSLLARFRLVQATLRCSPPLSAVQSLRPDQFISFPESTDKVRAQWDTHMLSSDPSPVQLSCMDADTVAELVRFLGARLETMLRSRASGKMARLGTWAWAVLGRCRDRGEMTSEEIGDLRDLARSALQLQTWTWEETANGVDGDRVPADAIGDGATAETHGSQTTSNYAPSSLSVEQLEANSQGWHALLNPTLDMIVTVVGEVYGQRDLLELRRTWPMEN